MNVTRFSFEQMRGTFEDKIKTGDSCQEVWYKRITPRKPPSRLLNKMTNQSPAPAVENSWCRKCLAGYRNTTICPHCAFSSDEPFEPKAQHLTWLLLEAQLRAVLPDLSVFVGQMRRGSLYELLENVIGESFEASELNAASMKTFCFKLWKGLQSVNQPSEIVRTVLYALGNELEGEIRSEFLSRPSILALGFKDALPGQERFEGNRYAPLPPLNLSTEEESLKTALRYLATREALSISNWQSNFCRSLEHGVFSVSDINEEVESWRKKIEHGERVEQPLTPWLLMLKKLGCESEAPDSLLVFAGIANQCMQSKKYWAGEEVAQATLRLALECSEAGANSTDLQMNEALTINLRGVIANCSAMNDDGDDMAADRARIELLGASMDAIAETICDTIVETSESQSDVLQEQLMSFADVLMQLKIADQCFEEGAFDRAELKYNRIILTCKNEFEENKNFKAGSAASRVERIMMVLPELLSISTISVPLVKAQLRLAEIEIKKCEPKAAEQRLDRALYYANFAAQRSTSALSNLIQHSENLPLPSVLSMAKQVCSDITRAMNCLRIAIFANLALLYDERSNRQKAVSMAKKAGKLLSEVKPSDLNDFSIKYDVIVQLCERLKK